MTTKTPRGRHRKLRRNILHTVIATALLAGTFTVADQTLNAAPANAAAPTVVTGTRTLNSTGTKFSLIFNETLGSVTALPSSFTLGGTAITAPTTNLPAIASVVASGTSLNFTLTNPIPSSLTLTVAYTAPTSNAATTNNAIQDVNGIDAGNMTAQTITVTGSSVPGYVSSTINTAGSQITLTFNEPLNSSTAGPSDFAVLIGSLATPATASVATPVSSVSVSGSTVLLDLETPVEAGKAVTVAYTAPVNDPANTNNAIQDSAGNDSASFTGTYAKTVTTTALTVPRLTTLAVAANGTTLTLTYSEALNATTAPASAFTVLNDSVPISVSTAVVNASTTVVLTLSTAIGAGKPVTVSYIAPAVSTATTNSAVQDSAGNDAISFSTTTVTNSSTQDQISPVISTATLDANGTSITLAFTDAANLFATAGGMAPTSAFNVAVNGVAVTVTGAPVTASSKNIVLALGSIVDSNDVVTVTYTAPAAVAGTGNAAIQDLTGNDSGSFANQAVTNNSSVPALVSINVSNTAGTTVVLTYSESLNATTAPVSAFTVVSGGRTTVPSTAVVSGSTITLTLPTGVERTGTVVVKYTAPAVNATVQAGAIQDTAGFDATSVPSLTSPISVTNNSTYDTTLPTITSATVSSDGRSINVVFSEPVRAGSSQASEAAWSISVNSGAGITPGTVSSIGLDTSVSSITSLTLTLAAADASIRAGQTVTLTYTNSSNAASIRDNSDLKLATASNRTVVNDSVADSAAPVLQSISVPATGNQIVLRYDETISSTLPAVNTTNFGITVNSVAWLPTSISASGTDVILTGPDSIGVGQVVTLTKYTAPANSNLISDAAIQDIFGNNAATLASTSVTNNSTLDRTAPTLVRSDVNADSSSVTLTFSENLSNVVSAITAFTVTKNAGANLLTTGSTITVTNNTIILTLPSGSTLEKQDVVRFAYTAPALVSPPTAGFATNLAIQDSAGNDLAASIASAITTANNSNLDTKIPTLTTPVPTVAASGLTLTMTYDESLSQTTAPVSAFTVLSSGVSVTPSSVSITGSTVVLNFATAIERGSTVTVAYTTPGANNATTDLAVQDTTGNNALSLTAQAATNNSTVDTIRPTLSLVARPTLDAAGTTLTLTFSEALAATTAVTSNFVVNVNGSPVTVSSVARPASPGTTITLSLAAAIDGGQAVTVTYTPPANDSTNANLAIQDAAGNDALAISSQSVTNNSTQGRPVFAAIIVDTNGQTMHFCYNKSATDSLSLSNGSFVFTVNGVTSSFSTNNGNSGATCPAGTVAGPSWTQTSTTVRIGDVVTVSRTETGTTTTNLRTITNFPVTNNSTLLGRPGVTSIVVDSTGTNIRLKYDGTAPNPVPALSDFQWSINGQIVPLTGSGATTGTGFFAANIISKIFQGDVVTATYVQPNTNIATVKSLTNLAVTNNSTADGTPPSISSVTNSADGSTLTLTFNEDLLASNPPLANQFAIKTNGYPTSVSSLNVSGRTVVLTLVTAIGENATASVTYTPPAFSRLTSNSAIQDASGNDSATFTTNLSPNSSTVNQGPMLTSSVVNTTGTTIVLTYDETLSSTTAASSAFAVTTNGTAVNVTGVTVNGSTVTLTVSPALEKGDAIKVAYTAPASDPSASNFAIQGQVDGIDAAPFALTDVTTNSSTADTKGPSLTTPVPTISSSGATLTLNFNEDLGQTTAPASAFTVLVDGVSVVPSSVSIVNNQAVLNFSPVLGAGRTVTVAYTAPGPNNSTSDNALQDLLGNNSASFAAQATVNNSTIDNTGPVLSLIARPSLAANGTTLTLTYNEALATAIAAGSAFTVMNGTTPVSVTAISRPTSTTIQLTLATAINAGADVTVAYTAPASDSATSNAAVQDILGNDSVSFAAQTVTNNSTQGPPGLVSGSVSATGTSATLVFSKGLALSSAWATNLTLFANGVPVTCSTIGYGTPANSYLFSNCSPTIPTGAVVTATWVGPVGSPFPDSTPVSFTEKPLTNGSTQPADVTAPTLSSIAMPGTNGQTIELTYSENLGGTAPTASLFTVLIDGVATTVSNVTVIGTKVTLTTSPPIEVGQSVSVAYAAPSPTNSTRTNAAIQDIWGNDVTSINATAVTNTSTLVIDRTAPTFQSVAMNTAGTQITLTYNEALNSKTAAPSDFSIVIGGVTFQPTAATVSGSTVVLTVGTTIVAGEPVSVSYLAGTPSALASNSAIQDTQGNDAASLPSTSVTNVSTGGVDSTSPIVNTVVASGSTVTLTLNEPLGATSAPVGAYTVFVGNTAVAPTSVAISGQTVVLTLPSVVPSGTIVAVSYTAPTVSAAPSNAALQDVRGNDAASFNVSTQPTSTTWEWVGGTPTQTCPGAGSAYPNSSKSKLLPNGVTYTVSVTGDYLCIDRSTESLSSRGGQAGDFQSVGLVTEPGLMMYTSNNGCIATELVGRCNNRGVMTISFSKPVTNPVVSFAGWGGGSNGASWSEMQLLGGMNGNTQVPGARFTALAGTNIQISQNGTVVGNVDGTIPAIYCHRTSGYGANSQAVCGSLQIEGVYTSVTFQVNLEYAAQNIGSDAGNEDAWNLTASIPEDFGTVPTSYDVPVASHAIGSLKLGSALTADNPSSLYATSNADAVSPGSEIKAGVKNISNGDVVVDDGVPQASWNGLIDNQAGQTFTIPVTLAGVEATAKLCAWIDFNRDGVFTAGERACATNPTVGQTSANISWTIPAAIVPGLTYARVRLSYDDLPLPSGKVGSGEVEDYSLRIASSASVQATSDSSIAGKDVNQTISPLLNDQFQSGAPNDMTKMFLCGPSQTPMNCTFGIGMPLTIQGEGTYTLNANGTVTFDPLPNFTGNATPIKYQIADSQSRTSSSTISPVVIPTPIGVADVSIGDYDKDQIINPLSNDRPGASSAPLVPSTLKLCATSESPNNCTATSVTIPNEGTYTLNSDGTVTFNPLPTFYGTVATPLKYQAQDSLGQFENSTITPTVSRPPLPTATNDISSGPYDTNQTISILLNDSSDGNEQTLKPESVKLCGPSQVSPNCNLTELTTADGKYTVNNDGTVTFDPSPSFSGTSTNPVTYQVSDSFDRKVSATITPTVGVPPAPSATADTITSNWDVTQSYTPLSNDTANSGAPLLANSLKLCGATETPNSCTQTSLTVANQGTYTVNPTTGVVTFDPLPTFTGTATPIKYQASDALGRFVDSTISPIIGTPPAPSATADAQTTGYDVTQSYTPASNDTANSNFPLNLTTVKLCHPATTNPPADAQVSPNCNATVVTTPDGVYTVNTTTGAVEFNPAPTFSGTVASPISYQVTDSINRTVTSTITPTIGAPAAPSASPNTSTGAFDTNQEINPLSNDTANTNFPLSATSVKLCGTNPVETPNNCTKTVLVIAGQGTYTVDPTTGVVTFDPLSTFAGTATPIKYQANDSLGRFVDSTIAVSVDNPPLPTANPNTSYGAKNATQVFNPLGNDTVTTGFPLDATSVKLCGTNPIEIPNNCTKTTLVVDGKGTFTVDPTTGYATFTPVTDYIGTVPTISYVVTDSLGRKANSTIDVVVASDPAMSASLDTSSGNYNTPQTINPLTNDSAGRTVGITGFTTIGTVSIDTASVRFCGPGQFQPNCDQTTITNASGTYTVNTTSGVVTFTPAATFTGTDVNGPTYQVCNTIGSGWDPVPARTCASAQIVPTVGAPPAPVANTDTDTTAYDTNKTVNPLTNDTANSSFPLNATTVKLCGAGQTPNGNPACDKTTLEVLNQGTYTVNPLTGEVTFNPLPSFTGPATPITYQVTDSINRTVSSTISITVGTPPAPSATNDTKTGPYDEDQVISPLTNDSSTTAFPFDQTTVKLCGPDNVNTSGVNESVVPNCVAVSLITADGVYTVNTNGTVTFNPDADFTGTATVPVTYQVTDMMSRTVNATITPTVGAPPLPVAVPDAQTSAYDTNQTYTPTSNDTANSNFPITANSVKLCGTGQVPPTCSQTSLTTADGVYTVNANGSVTFDPAPTFSGTVATPITYQATDSLDRTISSTITPTVGKPPAPTALPDATTGGQGLIQTVNLLTNPQGTDAPGIFGVSQVSLNAASVKLCSAGETSPNCTSTSVTVPNVGTYSVSATGVMTFTPVPTFIGTPPALPYTVTDTFGQKAASTYTPTVIARPTALNDTSSGPMNTAQTKSLVVNDSAAWGATPLNIASVKLCDPNPTAEVAPDCTKTSVTVPNVGTYSVDSSGVMTFTPVTGYSGTPTPLSYTVADNFGAKATATYTPTVIAPPTVVADTTSAGWDVTQTMNVVTSTSGANTTNTKTNSQDTAATGTTIKANSITIDCASAANCTETTDGNGVVTAVTMAGQGTYTVNTGTNVITFNPEASFVGTARPVTYTISDALDQVSTTTYTPTVNAATPPTADPETTSGPKGAAQTIDLLPGDAAAAAGITLDPTSVRLCPATTTTPQTTTACTLTTLTVSGVGTYVVVDGVMTFTPEPNYVGTPPPVVYQVTDSVGGKASSTYTPTVIAPPTLVPDTSTGPWDANQTRNVITNNVNTGDSAATETTLVAGSIRLCAAGDTAPNCTVTSGGSVVIANQGTYTVDPTTNIITFDPLPTFTGTATPVTYSVTDALGQKSSTTYTPTVNAATPPTADPETTSGKKGAAQTIDLLPGDATSGAGITLDPASVRLCPATTTTPQTTTACTLTTLTVSGVGTYAVSNGVMTFTPEPNYVGTPPPVVYQVTDSVGGKASSTYTPTVIAPPTLVPDTSTGPWDTNQTRDVVSNNVNTSDSPGIGTSLEDGSIRLCAPTDTAPNCTVDAAGEVVIANQGTYRINPSTNIIIFDPLPSFTGTATPINYSVTDDLGQKSSTTYTPTVTAPPVPTATPDTVELLPGQSKVFSSIFDGASGDTDPALATKGTGGPNLTNSTVCLIAPGTTTCDADGVVTITGEGTYTLNATTGIVTYAALSSATPGAKTPVTYKITDGIGRSVTSTLTPTITPPPVANPDFSTGVQGAIQTLSPVGNDRPGGGASTELFPDTRDQIPSGVFLCAANQPPPDCAASTVIVTDPVTGDVLGVLTVAATGLVTFTPEPNFIGTTPAIGYQIPDNLGQKAYSTITITVVPPPAPVATIDTGSAEYNKPVTLKPWINDAPGTRPDNSLRSDGTPYPAPNLVATSIKLCDDNSTFVAMSGAPADCAATKVKTVEGTYEVNATTGEVVFTPNPNMIDPITGLATGKSFVGTVKYPPTYQIWNNWTGAGGAKSATALLVPTIAPPGAPAAIVDITKTKPGISVVLNPVSNDKPGSSALDPTTIRLCGTNEISPACTQMSVTTLDGLYVVDPASGQVTFTPRDGFTGQATIPYIIMDGLGMLANANLIITVEDTAVVPVVKKTKVGLAKTGGHRPDLLLLLGILALVGAGGLRFASRKR